MPDVIGSMADFARDPVPARMEMRLTARGNPDEWHDVLLINTAEFRFRLRLLDACAPLPRCEGDPSNPQRRSRAPCRSGR